MRYIKFIIKVDDADAHNNTENGNNAFDLLMNSSYGVEQSASKIKQQQQSKFTEKDRLYNVVCDH